VNERNDAKLSQIWRVPHVKRGFMGESLPTFHIPLAYLNDSEDSSYVPINTRQASVSSSTLDKSGRASAGKPISALRSSPRPEEDVNPTRKEGWLKKKGHVRRNWNDR
jgi:hypothetical protein